MIVGNFFRALADFFTNILFVPYDSLRFIGDWWVSNAFNTVLFILTCGLFIYWLGQLRKFKKAGTE